ncbi:hypothetical protein FIBSPDRAFT_855813 [Athelia psychrophila]|uniref:Uncharacterized protein n=1 Tax=Athelia psychrophila TaxID=1759441 RepID=A0A166NQC0_9AGAM|nr:hypothetical protein FIBSPDRAFT_855813 [Fibularhizoctonia sp. CBS 109695]
MLTQSLVTAWKGADAVAPGHLCVAATLEICRSGLRPACAERPAPRVKWPWLE